MKKKANMMTSDKEKNNRKLTNKKMISSAKAINWVRGAIFTVLFAVEKILNAFVYPSLKEKFGEVWLVIITVVIAMGLSEVMTKLVMKIYYLISEWKNPKLKITGEWHHVHIPQLVDGGDDYSRSRLSVGTTNVSREYSDFKFEGRNHRCYFENGEIVEKNNVKGTRWVTVASQVLDGGKEGADLIEVYSAYTDDEVGVQMDKCPCCGTNFKSPQKINETTTYRYGVHKINVEFQDDGMYMTAKYTDCWPSMKIGTLYFFRDKKDRDEKIKQYFMEKERLAKSNAANQPTDEKQA